MKKILCLFVLLMFLISLIGCQKTTETEEQERKNIPYKELSFFETNSFKSKENHYLKIDNSVKAPTEIKKVEVAEDGSFFDDFTNGIDPDIWEIAQKTWGGGNHGVKRSNVAYTADGIVVLTGNGDLYDGPLNTSYDADGGLRSGACLVTKQNLGPGSFEAKVKVLPKMGACTAMWTFYYGNDENHEIDIEIPASTTDFKKEQFCTWVTEEIYTDKQYYPDFYHNDGEWHTYRFDWHTEPAYVEFYIDGNLRETIKTDIPDTAGNLWLGVWFPKRWSGVPVFDTGYMLVDYFKYTAFDEEHVEVNKRFPKTPSKAYPTEPIELPTNNFISNGDFQYDTRAWTYKGNAFITTNPETEDYMLKLEDSESTVTQTVYSIVPEKQYTLNFSAKGKGTVTLEYLESLGNNVLKTDEIPFDLSNYNQIEKEITIPKDCSRISITLKTNDNPSYFDDIYLVQPNRNDFNVVK